MTTAHLTTPSYCVIHEKDETKLKERHPRLRLELVTIL